MRIGELARRAGCSRDTIRFYERLGLVTSERPRGATNTYRHYDAAMVSRILLIKQAKTLGFTLAELGTLAEAWQAGSLSIAQKKKLFQDKVALAERRIAELQRVRRYLKAKLDALGDAG